tara:strand:- start:256 stop:510 length:255 start_codon:yes stop_codon:yes gene_type:complete
VKFRYRDKFYIHRSCDNRFRRLCQNQKCGSEKFTSPAKFHCRHHLGFNQAEKEFYKLMQLWQPEKIDMALGFLLRLLESASAEL